MTQWPDDSIALLRMFLVRHGETEGESSIRYHGRTDVPLSALGRAQMERVRVALGAQRFAAVYASALRRAVEGARIIGGGTPAATPVVAFNEVDFGNWEGLTAEEIRARDPEGYARWMASRRDFTYPGGESFNALRTRVAAALRAILAQPASGDLLFVVHKGVIRCMLDELLGADVVQQHSPVLALGSVHVVRRQDGVWHAEILDRTDHL
jgi:phosphoserine phosphatase